MREAKEKLVNMYKKRYVAKRIITAVALTKFSAKFEVLIQDVKERVYYK